MQFRMVDFWIQLHNIPLFCMTKEAGLQLGSKVGKVKDIDTGASGDCMGKFLRIRVNIDISQPLKRGIRADNQPFGPWLHASSLGMSRPARGTTAIAGPSRPWRQQWQRGPGRWGCRSVR
ncbi:hypothetical protein ACOSQ3_021128 [Xanthoceras sorbifolium]